MEELIKGAVKEPLNESMDLRAIWVAYIQEAQLIWPEPFDNVSKYEIFKNGELFMELTAEMFEKPSMFDHDHHTNLFWKTSNHEILVRDYPLNKFQKYSYKVKAYRYEGDVLTAYAESMDKEVMID